MLKKYETQENYKYKLPKIIIDNNNSKRNDHYASEEDRRVKNIWKKFIHKQLNNFINMIYISLLFKLGFVFFLFYFLFLFN